MGISLMQMGGSVLLYVPLQKKSEREMTRLALLRVSALVEVYLLRLLSLDFVMHASATLYYTIGVGHELVSMSAFRRLDKVENCIGRE